MSKKHNLADLIVMHADVLAKFIEAGFPITIGGTITLLPNVEKSPETIKVEHTEPTSDRPVPISDDEEAPFGRDSKGRAIAPYGLKGNGHPKRSPAGRPAATPPPAAAETTEDDDTEALDMSGDELDLSLEDDAPAAPPPAAKPAQKSAKPAAAPAPKATPKAAPKAAPDPFADLLGDL
jgi:hypothetical protein